MRHAPRVLLAAGLGFAVSFLVACGGGSNLLSGGDSSTLNTQLDSLAGAVEAGNCGGASRAAVSFSHYVTNLPSKVSPTLRANLLEGVRTVNDLAQQDCQTTSTAPSTTTTPSTSTAPTTTAPTTTAPTTTVSTTTPSTTSTTPATSSTTPSTTSTTPTTGGAGIGGGGPPTGGPGPGNGNGSGGGAPGQQ